MTHPLKGMKILDFTHLLPGPYGTMMLADMGADIIKVENFKNPDLLRVLPPVIDNVSACYAHLNRGKRSLGLNLKAPGAVEVIERLLGEYDIIVEQFRPGVMERLGLGYARLKEINSSLIYCSISGYGQGGSYRERAGHDINYLALAGVSSYSGKRDTGPSLSGIQIADIDGGSKNMVIGLLAAYIKRLSTGEGESVDISMTDGAYSLTVMYNAGFLAGGDEPGLETELLNGGNVYDYYATSDGRYLSVGPVEMKFFMNFCRVLELDNINFSDLFSMKKNQELKEIISKKIASRPLEEWVGLFNGADACVEPVLGLGEAPDHLPLSERGMVFAIKNHEGRELKQISNPILFSSGRCNSGFTGVTVGRHNREILKGCSYTDDEIERLHAAGAVN